MILSILTAILHGFIDVNTCINNEVQIHVFTELTPFSVVPLFGPEAGGTIVTVSYSFWVQDVMTSEDFVHNVYVTLDGHDLPVTFMYEC